MPATGRGSPPRPAPQAPPGRLQVHTLAFGPASGRAGCSPAVVVYWPHRASCLADLRLVRQAHATRRPLGPDGPPRGKDPMTVRPRHPDVSTRHAVGNIAA